MPAWQGGKENAQQEVSKAIEQDGGDDKAQYKHQQAHGKRPQQQFTPQGRAEAKRPTRAPWSEDAFWDDHCEPAEDAPRDIYGDWDMDAVAV